MANSRKSRRIMAIVSIILAIALVVGVNLLVGILGSKVNMMLDLTKGGVLSLSDLTKETLASVDKEVRIISLMPENYSDSFGVIDFMDKILSKYAFESKFIKYTKVDTAKNPSVFEKYKTPSGSDIGIYSIIVETDDKYTVVDANEIATNTSNAMLLGVEQSFTSAITFVLGGEVTKVYTVDGHGEVFGSNFLVEILPNRNFEFEDLSLLGAEVPDDAAVLFIAAPGQDFLLEEVNVLENYLNRGGKVVYAPTYLQTATTPILNEFLAEWGISYRPGTVYEKDPAYYYPDNQSAIFPSYTQHALTEPYLQGKLKVLMQQTQAINVRTVSNITTTTLLQSTKNSVSSIDGTTSGTKGPFPLVTLSEKPLDGGKKGSILAFGSVYFFDPYIMAASAYANTDFVSNSLKYLSDETTLLAIGPKDLTPTYISVSQMQRGVLTWTLVVAIPLLILVAGFVVWFRRKRS